MADYPYNLPVQKRFGSLRSMTRRFFLGLCFLTTSLFGQTQINFDDFFENTAMRVDFFRGMDTSVSVIIPDAILKENFYAGSKKKLVNAMNLGGVRYNVYDSATSRLIYSESYSDLFEEWQSSGEAKSGVKKLFHETARFPYPRHSIIFQIEIRNAAGKFVEFYRTPIDPGSIAIHRDKSTSAFEKGDLVINVPSESKIDILFLAEGYTKNETEKFKSDAKKMTAYLLDAEPYRSYAKNFNFRYVASVSEEQGTDEPDKGIYRNTIFSSSFNTFDIARYCTIFDNKAMHNAAAEAPYDYIVVLVNSSRYGGSGFYNFYSMFCADMAYLRDVWIHEFGHHFAGLADEYEGNFTGDDYYKTEPWEPNLTMVTDRDNIKWKKFIKKGTPVPTPNSEKYSATVGLFEGGGYASKGVYRAQLHCLMRELNINYYCAPCDEQVTKTIQFYSE
jgi:hypothetical protein